MNRVCHLTSTHKSTDQRILLKECVSLKNAGFDVCLIAQGKSSLFEGIAIIGTGEEKKSAFYRLLIRPGKIYKIALKKQADIYQIHDMELLPYAVKLKKAGYQVIFDCHEDFASRFADSDVFHLPKWFMKAAGRAYIAYEKYVIKKLDALISVTPHICNRLKESNRNTVMITNYPIIAAGNLWSEKVRYCRESDYICFAGQISCIQYALDAVVRAIQDIEGIFLHLYGPERRKGDIDYLRSLDSNKKVRYFGVLPFQELPKKISNSRMAIVTAAYSKDTGGHLGTLGNNKLFEAMLRGVPVIFTDFKLWREFNDIYHFGIPVRHGNIQDMKNAIQYLLNNPTEAEHMGSRGREAVLRRFNWTTQEKQLVNLYIRLKEKLEG
ncbi:MAG: glycosyltransferase family 4 protein [Lachnospiraceae bacterium]|jgi:glycosyltransferase involved in cell wall biosynthesis|nr:glycosyltransferase family 4 protein [Lachnospiraceae bacterium]